jgi:pimeloyl-[acyl-carrier protein] methyl ester esterase
LKALVLLHGWGMSPAVFDGLGTRLSTRYEVQPVRLPGYDDGACEPYELERIARHVAAAAPERCFVAGWSLGGEIAIAWARAEPQQIERMALIATTPCFVQRDGWSHAVEACVLQEFASALHRDAAGTLKRFAALQAHGDVAAKRVATALRACVACSGGDSIPDNRTLQRGLDVLIDTDLRAVLHEIGTEALVIHGERDALVPLAAAEYLASRLPRGRLAIVPGAAHAPFVSDAQTVADLMVEFFDG